MKLNHLDRASVSEALTRMDMTRRAVRRTLWLGYGIGSASALMPGFFLIDFVTWNWCSVGACAGAVAVAAVSRGVMR